MKMNKDEFRRSEVRGKIAEIRAGGTGAYLGFHLCNLSSDL